MCTYFKAETTVAQNLIDDFFLTLTVRRSFYREDFRGTGYGVRGYFPRGRKLCMQNLTKYRKQPSVAILQQSTFYNIFFRCLWIRIISRSDQGVQFMNFPSQISFNDINHGYRAALLKKTSFWLLASYMAVSAYSYYEKVRGTMHTVIVSYFFNTLVILFFFK